MPTSLDLAAIVGGLALAAGAIALLAWRRRGAPYDPRAREAGAARTAAPIDHAAMRAAVAARRHVVIDCETTGLAPERGHRIVSLAALAVQPFADGGAMSFDGIHLVFNPERRSDPSALRVHHLRTAYLKHQPRFAEEAQRVRDYLGDAVLVSHNVQFDVGFINAELARAGMAPLANATLCTMAAYRACGAGAATLDAAAAAHDIDVAARAAAHGALLDAVITLQLFYRMCCGVHGIARLDAFSLTPMNERAPPRRRRARKPAMAPSGDGPRAP